MADNEMNLVEFLFRLGSIKQQQDEIEALRHSQGIQQQTLQVLISSSKQTLAVTQLTSLIAILTVAMVVIGLAQIAIMLLKP